MDAILMRRSASAMVTSAMQPGVSSLWMMRVLLSPPKSAGTPSISVTRMRPPPTDAALSESCRPVRLVRVSTAVLGWAERSSTGWMLNCIPRCAASAKLSGRRGSSGRRPSSPATSARSVPCPFPVVAKLPYRPMSACAGTSPRSFCAV